MALSQEISSDIASNESDWRGVLRLRSVHPEHTSVLLVDDDPDQLRYLAHVISHSGYRVTAVSTVLEALKLLSERHFQLLISDLKMPDMNGFEFLRAVRALERPDSTRPIPVIVLTGTDNDVELAAIEQGADMFCEKFRVHALLAKQIRFLLEE